MQEIETYICSCCDEELSEYELFVFEDEIFCESCYDGATVTCDRCGTRIWEEDSVGDGNITLCQNCRDEYYTECEVCGTLVSSDYAYYDEDDDQYLCDDCREKQERAIHSYGYKPEPIFRGDGLRYFGVELEIDEAGEITSNAEHLLEIANRNAENLYCKHDGSLYNGFEMVTHPMTLDYHRSEMPWERILSKAVSMGYSSHNAKTCGLHIHVNRNSLGKTEERQEAVIARVLYFVETHWAEMLRFSRRTQAQLSQ
jgi:hypothetical protein